MCTYVYVCMRVCVCVCVCACPCVQRRLGHASLRSMRKYQIHTFATFSQRTKSRHFPAPLFKKPNHVAYLAVQPFSCNVAVPIVHHAREFVRGRARMACTYMDRSALTCIHGLQEDKRVRREVDLACSRYQGQTSLMMVSARTRRVPRMYTNTINQEAC